MDFQPMSPEDLQRTMQFVLNQQVQFAADFAKGQERFDTEIARLSAKTERIAEGLLGLTSILGQLATAQQRTDEQLRQLEERSEETRSNLDIVVRMFERHLREDHGDGRA